MKGKCHFDTIASKALTLKLCEMRCSLETGNEIMSQLIILMRNKNLFTVRKFPRKIWTGFISS